MTGSIYDLATGEIKRIVTTGSMNGLLAQTMEGEGIILSGADQQSQYVVDGELSDRPELSPIIPKTVLAVNEEVVIAGLRPGRLVINTTCYDLADDTLIISFGAVGAYDVRVQSFPYQDWTCALEVE